MERVEQYKQTLGKFILTEFVVFLSQIVVFFMVAVFTSNFLNSEEKLVAFSKQKINDGSFSELGLTALAILVVIGFFTTIGRVFDHKNIEHYVSEVLYEMPKTIYIFGSSVTGVILAISLFMHLQAEAAANSFAWLSLFFAFMVFVYGCGFSYAFKRKTHIKSKPNKKN